MKLFELIEVNELINELTNNNATIVNYVIDDDSNSIYVELDNGKDFDFCLDKK